MDVFVDTWKPTKHSPLTLIDFLMAKSIEKAEEGIEMMDDVGDVLKKNKGIMNGKNGWNMSGNFYLFFFLSIAIFFLSFFFFLF